MPMDHCGDGSDDDDGPDDANTPRDPSHQHLQSRNEVLLLLQLLLLLVNCGDVLHVRSVRGSRWNCLDGAAASRSSTADQ